MRTVDLLLQKAKVWLADNSPGGSDRHAWEAADAILGSASHEQLGTAVREILEASEGSDRDARNIVASFGRLHPPQSLSNPHRQQELIGLYLVLRRDGLWDTSDDLGNPLWREDLRRMLE